MVKSVEAETHAQLRANGEEHWAVDIGGIRVPQLPIPWLDFTYNFG